MPHLCLLTDQAVQFQDFTFAGSDAVYIVYPGIQNGYLTLAEYKKTILRSQTPNIPNPDIPVDTFRKVFLTLSRDYNEIIVILTSSQLNYLQYENAQKAAEGLKGKVSVQIVDSQTLSAGLAHLIVNAAAAISTELGNQKTSSDIFRQVQKSVSHIYTIFCTRDLRQLSVHGMFEVEHAIIGEMIGTVPVMILENGRIVATQKARNARHLVELLLEYLEEFYKLKQIYLYQSSPVFGTELNQLQERLELLLPDVPAFQIPTNPAVRDLLGNRAIGMIVLDE
jgi:fatty acid-binding protein DegV